MTRLNSADYSGLNILSEQNIYNWQAVIIMKDSKQKNDVKVIVQYEENINKKENRSLQQLMQRLYETYLIKVIQNINKGKWLFPNLRVNERIYENENSGKQLQNKQR